MGVNRKFDFRPVWKFCWDLSTVISGGNWLFKWDCVFSDGTLYPSANYGVSMTFPLNSLPHQQLLFIEDRKQLTKIGIYFTIPSPLHCNACQSYSWQNLLQYLESNCFLVCVVWRYRFPNTFCLFWYFNSASGFSSKTTPFFLQNLDIWLKILFSYLSHF